MYENKQAILNKLKEVLQMTRAGENVVGLEFEEVDGCDDAYVHVFSYDRQNDCLHKWLKVDVTGDSGIAMIRDVCAKIH